MGILQASIRMWVAMQSSRQSTQPRDWTQVSHIAGGFFTIWVTREALKVFWFQPNLPINLWQLHFIRRRIKDIVVLSRWLTLSVLYFRNIYLGQVNYRRGRTEGYIYRYTHTHNLKAAIFVLFGDLNEDYSPEDSFSDTTEKLIWKGKGKVRIYRRFAEKKNVVEYQTIIVNLQKPTTNKHSLSSWC